MPLCVRGLLMRPTTPAPIVADPVMQIVVNGVVAAGGSNATRCGNVFYYRRSGIGVINKANISAIFQTTIIVPLLAATNARYSPVSVTIRNLQDATDGPTLFAAAGAGAIATDGEPSSDAVVCYLRNSLRGRVFRGFKHFGGTSEVDTTNDILTGAGLTRWQAVRDSLKLSMTDAGGVLWVPFINSPYMAQSLVNPVTIRGSDLTISLLDLNIGTMRRRRSKTVR